jgi:esterase/lipase superfamily enzyme
MQKMRLATVSMLALTLAGCGSRGELAFAPEAAQIGTVETVLVSTTRSPGEGLPLYTTARADQPQFARFEVSVPPDREPGTVTFPRRSPPDPRTDFLVVEARRLPDERAFVSAVNAQLATQPASERNADLFVHGFNTNFAEGLYRKAQMEHDLVRRPASVYFAWPSAGSSLGYGYDRESALYSRGGLAMTIAALARSNARNITLVSHSMGGFLLMDTLWVMALAGYDEVFRKLNAVLLISPDVEIDLFRKEAPAVLARGVPIYVLVSSKDRALRFSARLRGEGERLGSINSVDDLGGLDVTVLDLSNVESTDNFGHFKEATSPAVIAWVKALQATGIGVYDEGKRPGLLEGSAALIQQGTDIVVAPLAAQ